MSSTVLLAWIHYLAVLGLAGAIFSKMFLLKLAPTADLVRTVVRVDRMEGGSAVLVFATGLARVWHSGKGADFYWSNGVFHGVVGLFVLAAALSVIPTLRFIGWRRALDASGTLPTAQDFRSVRVYSHVLMTFVVVIALLITMVAKGFGSAA